MDIESVYLHGGAKGFSYLNDTGSQAEYDSFFKRFYDKIVKSAVQKIDKVQKDFIIESIYLNGKHYYDYTLMEYYVYDVNGRPSYFGITIRLKYFYSEITELFFILDSLIKYNVNGTLLIPKGATYMYSREQIEKPLLDKVVDDLVELCRIILKESNITQISVVQNSKDRHFSINLIDSIPSTIEGIMSQYNRVEISLDTPLQRETRIRAEIKEKEERWSNSINDLQNRINSITHENQQKNQEIIELTESKNNALNEANALRGQIQNLISENKRYKNDNGLRGNVLQGLQDEKAALLKIAKFIDKLEPDLEVREPRGGGGNPNNKIKDPGKKKGVFAKYKKQFQLAAVFTGLLFLLCLLFSLKSCLDSSPSQDINSGKFEKGTAMIDGSETKQYLDDSLKIDIKEFSRKDTIMYVGTKYTARIIYKDDNKKELPCIKGVWIGNSFKIISDSIISPIIPNVDGQSELVFAVEGYEPLKRIVTVKNKY